MGAVRVQLDPDDLPTDDVFYAVHYPDASSRIFLTPSTGDDFDFLHHAVDSMKQIESSPFYAEDLPDADWPLTSVVIVRGEAPFQPPLVARLDKFLRAGGVAWLFLDGSPAQTDWMKATTSTSSRSSSQ